MTLKDTLSCGQRQVSAPFFRGGHPICGKARTRARTRARSNGTHAAEEVAHAPRPIPVRSLHPPSNVTSTARHLRRPTRPSDTTSASRHGRTEQQARHDLRRPRLNRPVPPRPASPSTARHDRPKPPPRPSAARPARPARPVRPPLPALPGRRTVSTEQNARVAAEWSKALETRMSALRNPQNGQTPTIKNIINNTHFHIKIFANVGVFIFSSSKPERLKREQESRERAGREPKREPRESKQDPQDPQDPKERRTEEINARQGSVRRFFHPIKTP